MKISRRQFLAAAAALPAAAQTRIGELPVPRARVRPPVCLYSQAVIKIEYADLPPVIGGMGFDGCDLSVLPGGHVRPDQASLDLVRAVESLRGGNVDVPVITTELKSMDEPSAREVLAICGILKIPMFRPGHWKYGNGDIVGRLTEVRRDIAGLGALAKSAGAIMALHNQPGGYVGESIWDTDAIIRGLDPTAVGYDFDVAHATIEGGMDGWLLALRLALPRLRMVTVHDFTWAKDAEGRWKPKPCRLGEGMVDWTTFFGALAGAGFRGPISLHVDDEPENEVAAIQKDLSFVRKKLAAAYPGAA